MDAIFGGIVGGLLGVVATTIGVLLARHLNVRAERERRKRDTARVVQMIVLEVESQREYLEADRPLTPLADSAFEVLRATHFLADLPADAAYEILNIYKLFIRINDKIEHHRQGVLANLSANEKKKINVESIRSDIDVLRREADAAVQKSLPTMKAIVKR